MRRIALVTPILPTPGDTTRGRFIFETARALSRLAEVKVFLAQQRVPGRRPAYAMEVKFVLEGVEVEPVDYPAIPWLSRAINGQSCARALYPALVSFAPELVLGYWIYPEGYGALRAAHRLGLPGVLGALGSDILMRKGASAWLTGVALRGADKVIVVSRDMARVVQEKFHVEGRRVDTIINGFNSAVFHPRDRAQARAELGLAQDERLIVYVGRLIEAKGLLELVDAFARLESPVPVRLALIGNGPLRAELDSRIEQLGLRDRVLLPGGQAPLLVAQWMAACDVLTLPSWSEGYPNVLIEAGACGRPVVASDVGGVREIVDEGNGIVVPARQADALAAALGQALTRPWDNAAIAAARQRSWDDVAAETLAVCEEAVSAAAARRSGGA